MDIASPEPFEIPIVVFQQSADAAHLYHLRSLQVTAPHVKLHHLKRFDDRLAAHLDGVTVAGEMGWTACLEALDATEAGALFVATVRALVDGRMDRLEHLFSLAEAVGDVRVEMDSAFEWVPAKHLRGIVVKMLRSPNPARRAMAINACAQHGVDPGIVAARLTEDPHPLIRARALRAAGILGCRELLSSCGEAIDDEDAVCRFWAAWAAVVLGNRLAAVESLATLALTSGPFRTAAFDLALQALPSDQAHILLRQLNRDPADSRWLIRGAGLVGNTRYVNWLIGHMADPKLARLAGESLSMITGADLAALDLERKPPENFEDGPSDDPEQTDVAMNMDDGLPWPDESLVADWWARNESKFDADARYFVGEPVTVSHCAKVLKRGFQRQRIAAATFLALLRPGVRMFNTAAPADRQLLDLAVLG